MTFAPRCYNLLFDLDGDGSYEYDASADLLTFDFTRGRSGERDTVPISVLSVTLRDEASKYRIQNASSPIYPNWTLNRKALLQVVLDGSTYQLFQGRIEDIENDYQDDRAENVFTTKVTIHDDMEQLQAVDVRIGVLQDAHYSPDMVNAILDQAAWSGGRDLATTTTEKFLWWPDGTALNAINGILESEMGMFWVDENGAAHYQDRHYRNSSPRAMTSRATFAGDFSTYSENSPANEILTQVVVTVTPRKLDPQTPIAPIFQIADPIILTPMQTTTVTASYSGPAANIIVPQSTTDYVAVDTTGTPQTGLLTVTFVDGPTQGTFTLLNTSATLTLHVTKLQVRGQLLLDLPIYDATANAKTNYTAGYWQMGVSQLNVTTKLAGAGATQFETNELHLTPQLIQLSHVADDVANGMLLRWGVPNRHITASIDNIEDALLITLLSLWLSDRITVNLSLIGVAEDFWIESIGHSVDSSQGDSVHNITMALTPVYGESFWVLDSSQLDSTAILGW